jgi:hypothetical protein
MSVVLVCKAVHHHHARYLMILLQLHRIYQNSKKHVKNQVKGANFISRVEESLLG